jgi:signal peptidase II
VSAESGRAWRLAIALCGVVVVADQAIKAIVQSSLEIGEDVAAIGPIEITNVHNRGIAFGLAGGSGDGIVVVTLVALGLILLLFSRTAGIRGAWVAIGLIAGGALGNLADRIRADAVTDYIDLPAWPAFNLADVAITFGVALLAWTLLREAET